MDLAPFLMGSEGIGSQSRIHIGGKLLDVRVDRFRNALANIEALPRGFQPLGAAV